MSSYVLSPNEFVFRNNAEFLAYQMQFFAGDLDSNWEPKVKPWILAPSDKCDFVHLTFIPFDGVYEIINNRAFYFKGYKEIIIQGQQIKANGSKPVLKIINERARENGPYTATVEQLVENHATGTVSTSLSIVEYETLANDDAVININNTTDNRVNVIISDIDIICDIQRQDVEQGNLGQGWFRDDGTRLVKVYEAASFKMQNVTTDVRYLNCTNVRLEWCRNVTIVDCTFINYNCRAIGGCLWLENTSDHITIENNVFRKFGNDEVIAIWAHHDLDRSESEWMSSFAFSTGEMQNLTNIVSLIEPTVYPFVNWLARSAEHRYAFREVFYRNIHIDNNRFFYTQPYQGCTPIDVTAFNLRKSATAQEAQWDGVMDILFASYVKQDRLQGEFICPPAHITITTFHITNNEFSVDAPIRGLISLSMDDNTTARDVAISHNIVRYSAWIGAMQMTDINVFYDWYDTENYDESAKDTFKFDAEPIIIERNTVISKCLAYSEGEECHRFLNVENAKVNAVDNCLHYNSYTLSAEDGSIPHIQLEKLGVELIFNTQKSASLVLSRNRVDGLKSLGRIEHSSGIGHEASFELVAEDNTFVGKTNFYLLNLDEANFVIRNNVFLTYKWLFMFQNFATRSTVFFEGNHVKRIEDTGYGKYDSTTDIVFFDTYISLSVEFLKILSVNNEFCFKPNAQSTKIDVYSTLSKLLTGSLDNPKTNKESNAKITTESELVVNEENLACNAGGRVILLLRSGDKYTLQ